MARPAYWPALAYTKMDPSIPSSLYFPYLFLSKSPKPLPFPTFCSSPKHALINPVQSQHALCLPPILCPTLLSSSSPQFQRWHRDLVPRTHHDGFCTCTARLKLCCGSPGRDPDRVFAPLWRCAWEQPEYVLYIPDFGIQKLCLMLFIPWTALQNALGSCFPSLARLGTDFEDIVPPSSCTGVLWLTGKQITENNNRKLLLNCPLLEGKIVCLENHRIIKS